MKHIKSVLLSLLFVSIFSCSSDDNGNDDQNLIPTTYYPVASSNYWNYKVSTQGTDLYDKLTVGDQVTLNTFLYNKMIGTSEPDNGSNSANGFYCNTLNNNNVRIDGSSLKITGNINYYVPGLTEPIILSISDFTILKQNASSGDILSTVSGSLQQTIDVYPVTVEYTLKSVADETLPSFTSNDVAYSDVKKVKLVLNVKISTTQTIDGLPTPITIVLLEPQDVITSTLHFANEIGVVYNTTLISYNLSSAATLFLPEGFPVSQSITQEEFLTSYLIN